jgi:hypothetical protein
MPPINPKKWGPHVWNFFHTLIEKIKEDKYSIVFEKIFYFIKHFCYKISCPECRYHASLYVNKLSKEDIKTKDDFIKVMFDFHNSVNIQLNKQLFNINNLEIYKSYNLKKIYKNFMLFYKPRFYLLENGINRNKLLLIKEYDEWFEKNEDCFDLN